ncbi:MAG: hypothetical protein ABEH89_00500 [bacterium]
MPYVKAGTAGFLAALVMFGIMYVGINVTGIAPFQVPPSAAFIIKVLGIAPATAKPLGLLAHFSYGIFWSIVLLALFWDHTSVGKGIGLAIFLWLGMMLVHSPIIGWGFFGFGGTEASREILQLGSGAKYVLLTLVLHLIYGAMIGWINSRWVVFGQEVAAEIRDAAEEDMV